MNEPKESFRLSGKNVFTWGTTFSLLLVGLIFLYAPKAPQDKGTPKGFSEFDGSSNGKREESKETASLNAPGQGGLPSSSTQGPEGILPNNSSEAQFRSTRRSPPLWFRRDLQEPRGRWD